MGVRSVEATERGSRQRTKFSTLEVVSLGKRKGGVCVQIPVTSFSGPALSEPAHLHSGAGQIQNCMQT